MSSEGKRPVTLEDLLRLKRAERPAPEFWDQFDRELRAKQLAALVQKRPWWREWPRTFAGLGRYHLPVGAAAVLALTFVTVRDLPTPVEQLPPNDSTAARTAGSQPARDDVTGIRSEAVVPMREAQPDFELASIDREIVSRPAPTTADEAVVPGIAASPVIPLLVGASEPAPLAGESPSARYIAANLAAVQAAESVAAGSLLGRARGFDTRAVMAKAAAVEPLQQMTPPSEVRLARYRSPLVATVGEDSEDRTGERVARRISGDRLYEHIGRIGARGDSVSWKF